MDIDELAEAEEWLDDVFDPSKTADDEEEAKEEGEENEKDGDE